MSSQGIDCASQISATAAVTLIGQGITYVCRYLGNDWKGMSATEAGIIKNSGLKIVSIFEHGSPSPTTSGYFTVARAQTDAATAVAYAQALGQPAGTAIYFTCDFFAAPADYPAIIAYFKELKNRVEPGYKVGAYGHYGVMEALYAADPNFFFMQTYAWSGGREASDFIHIYQYKNDVSIAGISFKVDHDEILRDPGAWESVPVPAPTPVPDPTPAPAPKPAVVVPNTYVVQAGDTLSGICVHFGLDMATVQSYNNIANSNLITVGEVLYLKDPAPAPKPSGISTYVVQAGDNLTAIAAKFHTTVAALQSLNGIADANLVVIGQVIKVPSPAQPVTSTTYKIVAGDTLSDIAVKFHTTVSALMTLNRISDANKVYVGQVIRVH